MKKNFIRTAAIVTAAIIMITFAGCGGAKVPERLIGKWTCDPVASDESTETGFYELEISEDGTFSLNDTKSGSPAIEGKMKGKDTGKLGILELTCNEDGFAPPQAWKNLHTNSRLRYKIIDENTIRLGYVGIWMTFRN